MPCRSSAAARFPTVRRTARRKRAGHDRIARRWFEVTPKGFEVGQRLGRGDQDRVRPHDARVSDNLDLPFSRANAPDE